MPQDNCPFTRTKKNDERRFNPHSPRAAICYQLHDDLRVLHGCSYLDDDEAWVRAVNHLKMSLDVAKRARFKHKEGK